MDDYEEMMLPDAIFINVPRYASGLIELALLDAGCHFEEEAGELHVWGDVPKTDLAVLSLSGCIDSGLD